MKREEVTIGMIVIANRLAEGRYSITRPGWIGKVINYNTSEMKVSSPDYPGDTYWVEPKYFDPYIEEADKETFLGFLSSAAKAPAL